MCIVKAFHLVRQRYLYDLAYKPPSLQGLENSIIYNEKKETDSVL